VTTNIFLGYVSWPSWDASVIFFIFGNNIAHSEHMKHHKTDFPLPWQCASYAQNHSRAEMPLCKQRYNLINYI